MKNQPTRLTSDDIGILGALVTAASSVVFLWAFLIAKEEANQSDSVLTDLFD